MYIHFDKDENIILQEFEMIIINFGDFFNRIKNRINKCVEMSDNQTHDKNNLLYFSCEKLIWIELYQLYEFKIQKIKDDIEGKSIDKKKFLSIFEMIYYKCDKKERNDMKLKIKSIKTILGPYDKTRHLFGHINYKNFSKTTFYEYGESAGRIGGINYLKQNFPKIKEISLVIFEIYKKSISKAIGKDLPTDIAQLFH